MKKAELPCTIEGVQVRFDQMNQKMAAFDKALEIMNTKKADNQDLRELCSSLRLGGGAIASPRAGVMNIPAMLPGGIQLRSSQEEFLDFANLFDASIQKIQTHFKRLLYDSEQRNREEIGKMRQNLIKQFSNAKH